MSKLMEIKETERFDSNVEKIEKLEMELSKTKTTLSKVNHQLKIIKKEANSKIIKLLEKIAYLEKATK